MTDPIEGYLGEITETKVIIKSDENDVPIIFMSEPVYEVAESEGYVEIQVWRMGPDLRNESSVMISTKQLKSLPEKFHEQELSPALFNIDYVGISQMIYFSPDQTVTKIKIKIDNDAGFPTLEGREIFQVVLNLPTNAVLTDKNNTFIIIDDAFSDSKSLINPISDVKSTSFYYF